MKNFIKELYYGNIDPQARGFKNGSYLKKQMTILSESEAMLTDRLTGETPLCGNMPTGVAFTITRASAWRAIFS